MQIHAIAKRAGGAAIAAMLAGCLGAQLQPTSSQPPPGIARIDPSGAIRAPGVPAPDRGPSWMAPTGATHCPYGKLPPCGLLYVSDYLDDDVFVFENDKLQGTLTGFNGPDGVCNDHSGDVWITNNLGESAVEYAHGGTTPIATLQDPNYYPLGCSVDPITGSVAIANIFSKSSGQGNIAIYHEGSTKALLLTDPDIYYVFFCAYDNQGNLYLDGLGTENQFDFAELLRNKRRFKNIALDKTLYYPGNVKWDGRHVAVGDQEYQNSEASAIYRTTGETGHVVGTTLFSGAQDVVGYDIRGQSVIAPDESLRVVGLYRYPAGGSPSIKLRHFREPFGAAISVGPQSLVPAPQASPPIPARRGPKPRGWISNAAKIGRTVYVTDNDEVLLFPEKGHNRAPYGEITDGVSGAYGLCVDRYGNLYVANQNGSDVTVYRSGQTQPYRVYSQDLQRPLYPIVDRDGDLWVGNAGNGTVVEYRHGTKAYEVLQTPGVESDGLAFDQQGDLYVAYRTSSRGDGSIEEFKPGSTQGTVLGMVLDQPQSVVVTNDGTILAVETGGPDKIDVFPPGYTQATLEVGVPEVPTQLALTGGEHTLFVSSYSKGEVFVTRFPLIDPNGSPNKIHEKIDVNNYGSVQGIALSNGQIF